MTGLDLITGEKLTTGQRVMTGVAVLVPVVSGVLIRQALKAAPEMGAAVKGAVGEGAHSVNAQSALRAKLSGLQKAQQNAAQARKLSDGRVRYYTKEVAASKEGPTRGASFVTEYNPRTGQTRQWMESYNHAGEVVRAHPKTINGQVLDAPHFPPTKSELP